VVSPEWTREAVSLMSGSAACVRWRLRWIVLPTLIVMLCVWGCSLFKVQYHPEFVVERVDMVRVGMTPAEVVDLFGRPDAQFKMVFGTDVGEEWEGLVYKYFTVSDDRYEYAERMLTNTFAFDLTKDPPGLNHWTIEHIYR
jgi:hypothetical protein